MKLPNLPTAVGFTVVILAASCSKAPDPSGNSKESEGLPTDAVRDYVEENLPEVTKITSLEIESNPVPSTNGFEVDYKLTFETTEDLLATASRGDVFAAQSLDSPSDYKSIPGFYEVVTAEGTPFTGHGKLTAEWQVDSWNFGNWSFDGDRPRGTPVRSIAKEDYVILGTDNAQEYFDNLREKQEALAEAKTTTVQTIRELFAPGKRLDGTLTSRESSQIEILVHSAEKHDSSIDDKILSFQGEMHRDGAPMPFEGSAWLNPSQGDEPPSATVSFKAKPTPNSSLFFRIRFAEGQLQVTEHGSFKSDLQPVN
jgi:hypothetical protein